MTETNQQQSFLSEQSSSSAQRAYAFLSFAYTTPVDGQQISGPLDCLKPIVGAALSKFASKQVNVEQIQKSLKAEYSLDLPAFILTKILLSLESKGMLTKSKSSRDIYLVSNQSNFSEYSQYISNVLQPSLEKIEREIRDFASDKFDQRKPIGADSWVEALIRFLKQNEPEKRSISKIKDKLVTNSRSGDYVIASFIEKAHSENLSVLSDVSILFTGILVDDFISTIQDLGDPDKFDRLEVFYDTPVLLRILGTSGKETKKAYREMHNLVTTLGCKTFALNRNIEECITILETIISRIDSRQEITGETAEALISNEIGVGEIRLLKDSLEDELSRLAIYPSKHDFSNTKPFISHQIDEGAFIAELQSAATNKGRDYRFETAAVDAESISIVCRLRRGHSTRTLNDARYILVTSNSLLAGKSKAFLIKEKQLTPGSVPPAVTVQQMTTAAWFAASHSLPRKGIDSQLVTRYTAALRPGPEWLQALLVNLQEAKSGSQSPDTLTQVLLRAPVLRALQDRTLNEPELIKSVSIETIAKESAAYESQVRESARAEKQAEMSIEFASEILATRSTIEQARLAAIEKRSEALSDRIVLLIKWVLALLFTTGTLLSLFALQFTGATKIITIAIFALATIYSVLSSIGLPKLGWPWEYLRALIKRSLSRFLNVGESITTP